MLGTSPGKSSCKGGALLASLGLAGALVMASPVRGDAPPLSLAQAQRVVAAAEAEATKNNWAVSLAIVDDGGNLLWFQRLDGAPPISTHIAPAKARTAALGRRDSKVYEDMINGGRTAFLSAPELQGMLEGGVPVIRDGQCLGAVGVSGVKSTEDAQIAKAGVAALATT